MKILGFRCSTVILAAIILIALILRLWGLDARGFSHPENFVSGIKMPDWVNKAANRTDWSSLFWGTLADGHPPGYFVGMFAWTKVFGTSLVSLRLPSVLFGTLTVYALYELARREGGKRAAVIAAIFIALSGFHIYWSQMARMYVPAAFLCVLSAYYLYRIVDFGRGVDHFAYGLTTTLALWTHIYCWPIIFTQILWVGVQSIIKRSPGTALTTQALAVIVSLPVLPISIYQNPPSKWLEPQWTYLQSGHLFLTKSHPFWGATPDVLISPWIVGAVSVGLVLAGLFLPFKHAKVKVYVGPPPAISRYKMAIVAGTALIVSLAMIYFAALVGEHRSSSTQLLLYSTALLPIVGAIAVPIANWAMVRVANQLPDWIEVLAGKGVGRLSVWLAVLPIALMLLVSVVRPSLIARGTLLFTPFLILWMAYGLSWLIQKHRLWWLLFAALLVAHLDSVRYASQARSGPRDYAGLAADLHANLQPSDLIFIKTNYAYPPLLYYFEEAEWAGFIHKDWEEGVTGDTPPDRVWVIEWDNDVGSTDVQRAALAGYRIDAKLEHFNAVADLYVLP